MNATLSEPPEEPQPAEQHPYQPPYGGRFPASQYPGAYPCRGRHCAPRRKRNTSQAVFVGLAVLVALVIAGVLLSGA